jgi:hypothetical protein
MAVYLKAAGAHLAVVFASWYGDSDDGRNFDAAEESPYQSPSDDIDTDPLSAGSTAVVRPRVGSNLPA